MATFTSVASGNWSDVDTWRSVSAWQALYNYASGNFVKPTVENGFVYEVTTDAGSSAASEPTWPTTIGNTVVDDGITWTCRAGVPQDNDAVTISANHSVLMDSDLSSYTGLQTVTITSHATTPGMLYFKDGTNGHLKLRTAYNLVGTNAAARGRLLANSDGVWGNTGALAQANKAVIDLQGTSQISGQYLEIRLYCSQPTTKYVRTYKTKYRVTGSASADTLTKSSHGLANGTVVMITVAAGGSLPSPLEANRPYFVVNTATDTFKLANTSGGTAIDLTTDGSGDIDVYDGHSDTGTGAINVLDDVTGESTFWVNTSGHNRIVLVNPILTAVSFDVQRSTISSVASGVITMADNVDAAIYPGARIYLCSRNVSIRSAGTSSTQSVIASVQPQSGETNTINAEVCNTAGSGSNYYGYGFGQYGITFGGVCWGLATAQGAGGVGPNTMSSTAIIVGCNNGISANVGGNVSGTIAGCGNGVGGANARGIGVEVFGCTYGTVAYGFPYFDKDCLIHCCRTIAYPSSGKLVFCGAARNSNQDFFPVYSGRIVLRNTSLPVWGASTNPTLTGVNCGYQDEGIYIENQHRTSGTQKIIHTYGNILQTACDGTGDVPSVDPDGGNGYCVEASNIQSKCGLTSVHRLPLIDEMRIWLATGAHTVTFKLQTTYAAITAGNLKLTGKYIGTDGAIIEATNAPAISQRSDDTDWSQTLAVTFTTTMDGWATFSIDLMEYESGNEVYVWPEPTIT